MPYYVHPSDWTDPERITRAGSANGRIDAWYPAISRSDFDCCASCTADACDRIDRYLRRILEGGGLSDAADCTIYTAPDEAHGAKLPGQSVTFIASAAEKDRWRMREMQRFASGHYAEVPWAGLEPFDSDRFPHISIKTPGLIAFTKSEEHGVLDRQTAVKPGRYLKEFFPDMPDAEIRDWSTKVGGITFTLNIATDPDEIEQVYVNGPGSCMSHHAGDYHSSEHPVRVYGDSDLAVAYYGPKTRPSARAVIWPERKIFSRIYGGEILRELLQRDGYRAGSLAGAHIRAIEEDNGQYIMPYIDGITTARVVIVNGRQMFKLGTNGGYCTQPTNGVTGDVEEEEDNSWSCYDCGNVYDDDDSPYDGRIRIAGTLRTRQFCESCYDERFTRCSDCDEVIAYEDAHEREDNYYCASCVPADDDSDSDSDSNCDTAVTIAPPPTYPRYFTNCRDGFSPAGIAAGVAYVEYPSADARPILVYPNGDRRVYDSGIGWGITAAESFVSNGGWRELTATEAAAMITPPARYFTHAIAYGDNTAYIRVTAGIGAVLVRRDGSSTAWGVYEHPLTACLSRVNSGAWREITADQASALVTNLPAMEIL